MKALALISWLMLLVAVSATAASPDTKKTETVTRDVNWAISTLMTFELDPDAPLGVRTITDGSGQLTRLGAATIHTEHTFWPDEQGTVTDGEVTITAANGDQIWATYTGTSEIPDPAHFIGHSICVIIGGTGRFATAIGTLRATGFVTVTEPPSPDAVYPTLWVLEGTISY